MDPKAVTASYKRWAPVYDRTFGRVTEIGRRKAVNHINTRSGKVLEVGVGTGLSLGAYRTDLEITGIDFSEEMLAKARRKVEVERLSNVAELRPMDARMLDYPDECFDTVVAMYLVSVVPEPERVVEEMARVCKTGGEVVILNHFARDHGMLAVLEKSFAPFAAVLGWHSDFPVNRVLQTAALRLKSRETFPPFGMFTFLRLEKRGRTAAGPHLQVRNHGSTGQSFPH